MPSASPSAPRGPTKTALSRPVIKRSIHKPSTPTTTQNPRIRCRPPTASIPILRASAPTTPSPPSCLMQEHGDAAIPPTSPPMTSRHQKTARLQTSRRRPNLSYLNRRNLLRRRRLHHRLLYHHHRFRQSPSRHRLQPLPLRRHQPSAEQLLRRLLRLALLRPELPRPRQLRKRRRRRLPLRARRRRHRPRRRKRTTRRMVAARATIIASTSWRPISATANAASQRPRTRYARRRQEAAIVYAAAPSRIYSQEPSRTRCRALNEAAPPQPRRPRQS